MKNKPVLIVVGVIVAIAVIAGGVVAMGGDNDKSKNDDAKTASASTTSYKVREACSILTKEVAVQLAGDNAAAADTPDTKSADINVSQCNYYSPATKTTVSLLVRSPKTSAGAESNKAEFTTQLPAGAQKVSGLGDLAFWSPTYGQLNIYKNNTWYILSSGPLKAVDRNLTQAQQYANLIIANL